jgi:Asp-tRNA(Asn)/Glu-tRNA(Gln) amidotransferase A subunit family amidase
MHGVPFTIKECFDLAGTPTTAGWKKLANEYPSRDAPDVERLKAAGAIPVGHTNLATFTVRWHCETRQALLRQWGEFQETRPLILAPVCTGIPFKVGTDLGGDAVARTIHDMRMAIAVNALGLPAVAVPVGVADGLPQVVQIIGPRYREDLVLDAAALEDALGVITPIDPR